MEITQEISEAQKDDKQIIEAPVSNEQHRVLNYFKEHTGFLVACISAMVAVMSFVVRFAIGRMNYAYLEYWNIPTLYANADNQNEYYLIICTLLYILALMIIHAFLSKTSGAYRYYNKLQSTVGQQIKHAKRTRKELLREIKICSKLISELEPEEKDSDEAKEVQELIEKAREDACRMRNDIREERNLRGLVMAWIVVNVGGALSLSFVIGMFFALLLRTSITMDVAIQDAKVILWTILLDVLLYFLPAYWKTRCTKKQYKDLEISKFLEEMHPDKSPGFPMNSAKETGFTTIFSDRNIRQAITKFLVVTILLLFFMPTIGTQSAKLQKEFPIYYEDSKAYAIVYIGGTTVFMEEAVVQDGTIVIDTSSQRIVTANDLSYERVVFEKVSVLRRGED